MATISTLVPYVESRVDEAVQDPPVWVTQNEIASAISEAMCDLMLLVARPDLIVSTPFTIQPNTPWQILPEGMFVATNIQGTVSEVWKGTLADLDGCQVAGPDWEQDVGDQITFWAPIGLGQFVVHPSVAQEQVVLLTGIASPVVGIWPPAGATPIVFHDEFFQAIEKYAAHYLRFKEAGSEWSESIKSEYQSYLGDAKRMTALENRRDDFIFAGAIGAVAVTNPNKIR